MFINTSLTGASYDSSSLPIRVKSAKKRDTIQNYNECRYIVQLGEIDKIHNRHVVVGQATFVHSHAHENIIYDLNYSNCELIMWI